MKNLSIAFIGNPNCGKTTLFNSYTGQNLKVANWPGVTVEKKEGEFIYKKYKLKITDLPGIYSLNSYSIEEKISREYLENEKNDVVVDIIDASSLERNLYLALQLIESGATVILAFNMMDIVRKRGIKINIKKLENMLGVHIVPISAKKRRGLEELMNLVIQARSTSKRIRINIDNEEEITKKYDYISRLIEECIINKKATEDFTDKVDRILTHRLWGIPIFILIMGIVFFLTFSLGDKIKEYFEIVLKLVSNKMENLLEIYNIGPAVTSLIINGVISGGGGILTFLPNIFILFTCLAILEDSGYMARVAFIMNDLMRKLGLHGKACIPMILGFGCSVPAVMATRTLKDVEDRKNTIMLIPCMSCSAKIPIYVLFSSVFFKEYASLVALSMYIIGIIIAIGIGIIIKKTEKVQNRENLIIELPEYKMPDFNTVIKYVWEKVKDYLDKAGTIILISSIILWGVLNIGPTGFVCNSEESFSAIIGKALVPVLEPAGLGYWQIAVALISGVAAKEVVVSSMSVLYGMDMISSQGENLYTILNINGFQPINALCLMIFSLLYVPCIATIATIKSETKSTGFTIKLIAFQMIVAWLVSTITYQVLK